MTTGKYILKGKEVVLCTDLMQWAEAFEKCDRRVAFDEVNGVKVSTLFLGLDFGTTNKPQLFETMVIGGTSTV